MRWLQVSPARSAGVHGVGMERVGNRDHWHAVRAWLGGIAILVAFFFAAVNAYLFVTGFSGIDDFLKEHSDGEGILGVFLVLTGSGTVVALLTIRNARKLQVRPGEGPWVAVGLVGSAALLCLSVFLAVGLGSR